MFEQFLLAHLSGAHFHNFLSHAFLQFLQQHKLLINVFLVEGCTVEHLAVNTVTFRDTSDCECHTELFPCWDTFGSDACYPSHSSLCNITARRNRWTHGICTSDNWSWSVKMVWGFRFLVMLFPSSAKTVEITMQNKTRANNVCIFWDIYISLTSYVGQMNQFRREIFCRRQRPSYSVTLTENVKTGSSLVFFYGKKKQWNIFCARALFDIFWSLIFLLSFLANSDMFQNRNRRWVGTPFLRIFIQRNNILICIFNTFPNHYSAFPGWGGFCWSLLICADFHLAILWIPNVRKAMWELTRWSGEERFEGLRLYRVFQNFFSPPGLNIRRPQQNWPYCLLIHLV